jgi:hypothetical protein
MMMMKMTTTMMTTTMMMMTTTITTMMTLIVMMTPLPLSLPRCSDQPDCDYGYAGRAAGFEKCFNFNPAVITQDAFICFFCCVNNECNRHERPDQQTIYYSNSNITTTAAALVTSVAP